MRRAISGGLHLFKWKNIIIKTVEYNKGNGIMSKEKKFVCEKNDELELDITDLGSTGEGIGKIDGDKDKEKLWLRKTVRDNKAV